MLSTLERHQFLFVAVFAAVLTAGLCGSPGLPAPGMAEAAIRVPGAAIDRSGEAPGEVGISVRKILYTSCGPSMDKLIAIASSREFQQRVASRIGAPSEPVISAQPDLPRGQLLVRAQGRTPAEAAAVANVAAEELVELTGPGYSRVYVFRSSRPDSPVVKRGRPDGIGPIVDPVIIETNRPTVAKRAGLSTEAAPSRVAGWGLIALLAGLTAVGLRDRRGKGA